MSWLTIKKSNKPITLQSKHLSAESMQELLRVLSTPQMECFDDVLIPFLERLRNILRSNPKGDQVFSKRFKHLCGVLKAIKADPQLPAHSFAHHTQIKIVTVFLVLRIMLCGLATELPI